MAPWPASAQDVTATTGAADEAPPPAQPIGYAALPGGLHAASAETLPAGVVQVATLGGFGWRSGLLGDDHRFGRGIGNLAIAYAPTELISIGLSLDGRYDKHFGLAAGDDGYVGDPHLLVRVAKPLAGLRVGGQLGVWAPGKDAPSLAGSAITVDAIGLVGLKAGPGWLTFSAGFRLDNSANAVDDPTRLSMQDRVSLGVSEFHAAVGGAHVAIPVGKAFVNLESTIDVFVGSGDTPAGATAAHEAPGPLIRLGASVGFNITPQYAALAFVQAAKVPGLASVDVMADDITLIAYEPAIMGGIGLQARFGGPEATTRQISTRPRPAESAVDVTADLSGTIVDDAGKPVVGAKVNLVRKRGTTTAVTDERGDFVVKRLPIGKSLEGQTTIEDADVEVTCEVGGKKPVKQHVTLKPGANKLDTITVEPVVPPGELRGVVRSVVTGRPLSGATIAIEPGGLAATSGADGRFSVALPPGQYKITVSSAGLKDQKLDVTIDPNGVAIKNIELRR
jgi:hypothetical protein